MIIDFLKKRPDPEHIVYPFSGRLKNAGKTKIIIRRNAGLCKE